MCRIKQFFAIYSDLHDSGGKRIDATILLEKLRTKGDLDAVGGAAAIAELISSVPHAAHASHYMRISFVTKQCSGLLLMRALTYLGMRMTLMMNQENFSQAEEKIFSILEQRSSAEAKPIQSVLGRRDGADGCSDETRTCSLWRRNRIH